jgi:hypothetical protein
MALRQPDVARFVANIVERLAHPRLVTRADVRVIAPGDERRPESPPRLVDAPRTTNVDENEGITLEYAKLTLKVSHRDVSDEALHLVTAA